MELKDIENLADLAKIALSAEEKEKLRKDLNSILRYVEEIQKVSAVAAKEEYLLKNQMREDEAGEPPGLYTADLLSQTSTKNGFIKVKKVL